MINQVEIKFEPENRQGMIAVGSYLFDAAKRLGVSIECERTGVSDACSCQIKSGGELLSEITKLEMEQLSDSRRKNGERLACQAKIEKPGEIIAMTTHKKVEAEKDAFEQFCKDFAELPLTEKAAKLLQLESIALSDTFSAVLNLPYTIGEKIRDMMAEVGMKMEEEAKKAKTPDEHKPETETKPAAKKPTTAKKRTVKPKTEKPAE